MSDQRVIPANRPIGATWQQKAICPVGKPAPVKVAVGIITRVGKLMEGFRIELRVPGCLSDRVPIR
jgi:hypothetical protein